MYRRLASSIVLLSLSLVLSACGFQLRGVGDNTTQLPESWKSMYLSTANPNSEFSREVEMRFAAQGIAYIPAMIIQQELADNKLQPLLPAIKSRNFQLWAYYQKLDYVPVKIRAFLDYLKIAF